MIIRELKPSEIHDATTLALEVFMKFESPDYGEEGTQTFAKYLQDAEFLSTLRWYGAFCGQLMVGMIATRKHGAHIALFFVDETYHRQGIGRRLFETAMLDANGPMITVNAAPTAVTVYRKLGFVAIKGEQVTDGIRFTPMRFDIQRQA